MWCSQLAHVIPLTERVTFLFFSWVTAILSGSCFCTKKREYEGNEIKRMERAVIMPRNFLDWKNEDFVSQPHSSALSACKLLYHAKPNIKNVPATKKGRYGSSHETEDIKPPEPPTIPRNGTMQQSDALAEVNTVSRTDAFISFPKL